MQIIKEILYDFRVGDYSHGCYQYQSWVLTEEQYWMVVDDIRCREIVWAIGGLVEYVYNQMPDKNVIYFIRLAVPVDSTTGKMTENRQKYFDEFASRVNSLFSWHKPLETKETVH